ncbi:MAG: tetratricopeptide repeat protein [Planctomycetes bacterium]|nr:tetratricopeptide repeat protein [Planctomycetota bacterium]
MDGGDGERPVDKEKVATLLNERGRAHFLKGEYDKSVEYFHQALIVREVGDWRGILDSFAAIGLVYATLGKVDRARAYVDDAREILDTSSDEARRGRIGRTAGVVTHAEGDAPGAVKLLEGALADLRAAGEESDACDALLHLVDACLEAGDVDRASRGAQDSEDLARRLGDEDLQNRAELVRGLVAGHQGQFDDALNRLFRVEKFADRKGWPELRWRVNHAIGKTYFRQKNPREAAKYYIRAMDILKRVWNELPPDYKETYLQHRRRRELQADIQQLSEKMESARPTG